MSENLKSKTIRGITWNFIEIFSRNGMNFIIGIILARLLSPTEFGIIGMVMIFIVISDVFIDSGFRQALIRKKECTQADYSTVFYFNVAVSIVLYCILFFSSGLISSFFNVPALKDVVKVMGLVIIINSFRLIQQTMLEKRVNFRFLAKITFTASLISGLLGIALAYSGFGVWSLVIKMIAYAFLVTLLCWAFNRWFPVPVFSIRAFNEHFSFGSKILLSQVISKLVTNTYVFIIARYFSVEILGFYAKANSFNSMISGNLETMVSKVSYPVLASINDDNERLKRGYRKIIKTTMFMSCFAMLFIGISSEALIVTLLGERWLQTAGFLSIMCYGGMLFPMLALNSSILKVKGRSDLFLTTNIAQNLLVIPAVIIGITNGIIPMLYAMLANSIISYFIRSHYSGKLIDYKNKEQVRDVLPGLMITACSALPAFFIKHVIAGNNLIVLITQFLVMFLLTILLAEMFKLEPYLELKSIQLERLGKFRKIRQVKNGKKKTEEAEVTL